MTDPTALCVAVLSEALPCEVSGTVPALDEGETYEGRMPFVTVSQTGGTSTEFVQTPVMAVRAWASSDAVATALVGDCEGALRRAASSHPLLSHVEVVSVTTDPWAEAGASRYVLTVRLTINI